MLFFKLLSYLPISLLYGISDLLFVIAFRIFRYRKKVIFENLKNSFPEKNKEELEKIAVQFFRHLCDLIVETIKLLSISKEEFIKRVTLRNIDLPLEKLENGRSIIVLCGHTGNWEWLLQACAIHAPFPIDAVYKPLSNKKFDQLMLKIRSRFGASPLPMKEVPRSVIRNKGMVRGIAMVADQTPPRSEIQFVNNFLSQITPWFVGAEKIARMADLPVLFVGMKKIKRGYYEVYFEEISNPPYNKSEVGYQIINEFSQKLEKNIQSDPSHWLWSHRRWKHSASLKADEASRK